MQKADGRGTRAQKAACGQPKAEVGSIKTNGGIPLSYRKKGIRRQTRACEGRREAEEGRRTKDDSTVDGGRGNIEEGRRKTVYGDGKRDNEQDGPTKEDGRRADGGKTWSEDGILKNAEGRRTRDEGAKTAWGQTRW